MKFCGYCLGFIFLSLFTFSYGYFLQATPDTVNVGVTRNVQLECTYMGGNLGTSLANINRVRIEKMVNGIWTLVSEMVDVSQQVNTVDHTATSTGSINGPTNTFLRVTWDVATSDTPGTYRCEFIGLDAASDFVVQKTDSVDIRNGGSTDATNVQQNANLQHQIDQLKDHTAQELTDILNLIRENQLAEMQIFNAIHSQLNDLSHKQTELDQRLTALEGGGVVTPGTTSAPVITQTVPTIISQDLLWPGGTYGLFEPSTGCPANTLYVQWKSGYRRHRTESQYNQVSAFNHMIQPSIETINGSYFIYERFCVVDTSAFGGAWPRGSYCINRNRGTCPSGFRSGYINIDDISTDQDLSGSLPDGIYSSGTTVYYCCRNDSSTTVPVILPTATPFYLYRYGDTCQTVLNMSVEQEWVLIDTADFDNQDTYENQWHPSGNLNDFRLQLCYYTPLVV